MTPCRLSFLRCALGAGFLWAGGAGLVGAGAMVAGMNSAEAATLLPPPSAAPRALPPIPGGPLPGTPLPPAPPSGLPDKATTSAGFATEFNKDVFFSLLQEEGKRLQDAVYPQFSVVLLTTDDPQYQQYVASGLFHMNVASYSAQEAGLQASLISNGKVNGRVGAVCYVMLQPERAEGLWNQFVVTMSKVSALQTGAAYLMGHEVGHCLDQQDRNARLSSKMAWGADDAATIGLSPDAIRKVYGGEMQRRAFLADPIALLRQPAQEQYTERAADAFGVLWMMKLGATKEAVDFVIADRAKMSAKDRHQTGSTVALAAQQGRDVTRLRRADTLFALARELQVKAGVTPEAVAAQMRVIPTAEAVAGEPAAPGTVATGTTATATTPQIARWVVTPRGPVAYDAQGNEIPQQALTPGSQNFRNLKRFGSKN